MKWQLSEPVLGDMIRVKTGEIYHYGVFVSDEEIIQFGLAPRARVAVRDCDVTVLSSSVDEFLCGGFLEVAELDKKELKTRIPPQKTVEIARSRIGEKGYNILYNNCEHFAYECVLGKRYCSQTDGVRSLFQSMPLLSVMVAEIPKDGKVRGVYPVERQKEIDEAKNEGVKRRKYYVWKLLEYALEWTFGTKIDKVKFHKSENGKWSCDKCEFSLSHSENAVAVALSRKPVGVDVELIKNPVVDGLEKKILSDAEVSEFNVAEDKTDYLITAWSKKESVFKRDGGRNFAPKQIENYSETHSTEVEVAGERYRLAVTSENLNRLKIKMDVKLF